MTGLLVLGNGYMKGRGRYDHICWISFKRPPKPKCLTLLTEMVKRESFTQRDCRASIDLVDFVERRFCIRLAQAPCSAFHKAEVGDFLLAKLE